MPRRRVCTVRVLRGVERGLVQETHLVVGAASIRRPWLLPFIAEKATGAERDLLLTLIRHASAHQPEHRPSFAEMVDHLDRFEHQKRGN